VAEPINLEVLDPPDVDQTQFGPDMKRWLSNVVDIINASFTTLSDSINFLNNSFSYFISSAGINIGSMGAGPINVAVEGLTPSGFVTATIVSSSNPATITNITPLTNSFDITFSADPGVNAIIVYQAYMSQP
jgi:hypothetical protein